MSGANCGAISRTQAGTSITATGRRPGASNAGEGEPQVALVERGGLDQATLAFVREQPAFAREAAAVAGERTVRADHAVTGHDDGNRVLAVRKAHRARGLDRKSTRLNSSHANISYAV